MSYVPPGVPTRTTPEPQADAPKMGVGVHTCSLVSFVEAAPSPAGKYYVAFIATYQNEKGEQIKDWIKWVGTGADYYAGLRIERLCAIFGAPVPDDHAPLDPAGMMEFAEGIEFLVKITENTAKDGRVYLNIEDVMAGVA